MRKASKRKRGRVEVGGRRKGERGGGAKGSRFCIFKTQQNPAELFHVQKRRIELEPYRFRHRGSSISGMVRALNE
jgi:hypothetical protein